MLIVVGHLPVPSFIREWIFSFHVPLFFFISGFLYKPGRYSEKELVLRKFRTLLVPYFFFMIPCVLTNMLVYGKGLDVMFPKYLIKGCGGWPIWFLYVLFFTELLGDCIYKLLRGNNWPLFISAFALSGISYWFYLHGMHFPYKLELLGMSAFYYLCGIISRQSKRMVWFTTPKRNSCYLKWLLVLPIVFCLDVYLAIIVTPDLNMVDNVQGVYFPTIMLALLGIWFSIQFSYVILKNDNVSRIFKYIGKNTIVILGFSQPIWLTTFFLMKKTPIPIYISVPLMLVILGGALLLCIVLFDRYLPFFIGKQRNIKQ